MDGSNSQVSRLLDILGEDQLQHMLERFVPIVPFPLCVLDLLGNIIASTDSQGFCEMADLRFQIDLSRHLVKATTHAGEAFRTFAAPLHIHDDVDGYVRPEGIPVEVHETEREHHGHGDGKGDDDGQPQFPPACQC